MRGRTASPLRRFHSLTPRGRWALVSSIASAGFVLAVVAYTRTHGLSSDDVAIQNIVQSVLSGERLQPSVGNDNFIIKVPIYLLIGLLPHTTWTLALTVLLCNAPLVIALLVIGRRLLGDAGAARQAVGALLICWYLCAQLVFLAPTIQINGRNGEIGVALLLVWWRLSRGRGSRTRGAFFSVLSVAAFALLFFSDLFFLFVLVPSAVALFATACVLGRFRDRSGLILAEIGLAAVLAEWLLRVAQSAGLVISQNFASATPVATELPGYATATLAALGRDLNADVWGQPLGIALAPGLLQLALLISASILAVRVATGLTRDADVRVLALLWIAVVNIALFVMTSNAADALSFRYVFLAAVVIVLLAVRAVASIPAPRSATGVRVFRGFAILAAAGVAVGFGANLLSIGRSVGAADPQARVKTVIALAESHGARVGVGAYWDANITTWYSGGRVEVLPQTCDASGFVPYAWLVNVPEMRRASTASFVVLSASLGCTAERAQAEFGQPDSRAEVPGGDEVWFYERPLAG